MNTAQVKQTTTASEHEAVSNETVAFVVPLPGTDPNKIPRPPNPKRPPKNNPPKNPKSESAEAPTAGGYTSTISQTGSYVADEELRVAGRSNGVTLQ